MRIHRILTALALTLVSSVVAAQPPSPLFWWSARVHGARVNRDAAWPTFVLGGSQDAFEMVWTFRNDVGVDIVTVVPEALESRIDLRVKAEDRAIETTAVWAVDGKWVHDDDPVTVRSDESVLLHPGDWLEWRLSLRRKDGAPWTLGTYDCTIGMGRAMMALRRGEQPWPARGAREGRITMTVENGLSKEARRAQQRFRASEAMSARQPLIAVEHYRQILAEDPADESAYAGLGMALVAARRYQDAIGPLERALPLALKETSTLPDTLAFTYLAIGDERNAMRIIRLVTPEAQIPAKLEQLKAAVQRDSGR